MTITIGPHTFDRVAYDAENDVLELGEGGVADHVTNEHAWFVDETAGDTVVGAIFFGPRAQILADGEFRVQLLDGQTVVAADVATACS